LCVVFGCCKAVLLAQRGVGGVEEGQVECGDGEDLMQEECMLEGEGYDKSLPYASTCLVRAEDIVAGLDGTEVEEFQVESSDVGGEGLESTRGSEARCPILKKRSWF
jgi:hypothetical protein